MKNDVKLLMSHYLCEKGFRIDLNFLQTWYVGQAFLNIQIHLTKLIYNVTSQNIQWNKTRTNG